MKRDRRPKPSKAARVDAVGVFLEWDPVESDAVAILRAAAGRDPYDKALTDLVGELSTRSERYGTL